MRTIKVIITVDVNSGCQFKDGLMNREEQDKALKDFEDFTGCSVGF